jgi:hypothetical protein
MKVRSRLIMSMKSRETERGDETGENIHSFTGGVGRDARHELV